MKSISEERAPLQGSGSTAEPSHVFTDCSRTGGELHVYADHLEVHSDRGKEVRALWYCHIRTVARCRENGSEALATFDRGGQILLVPMDHMDVAQRHRLITNLMEWTERSRG
jgi:hypothetical protein